MVSRESFIDNICIDQIKANLDYKDIIDLYFCSIIDSTNNYLLNNDITNNFGICIADEQTAGRGRSSISNKTWQSPANNNIYCSIGCNYNLQCNNINNLMGLSLVAGLAVAEILTEIITDYSDCNDQRDHLNTINIKWPNDVYLNNKKIAGILVEINQSKIIVGIGVNIYNNYNKDAIDQLNKDITQPWTSLSSIFTDNQDYNNYFTRNLIISRLINKFISYYQKFINCGLNSFMELWQQYDILSGRLVEIKLQDKLKHGRVVGIDQQGSIILNVAGKDQVYHSGEITIRSL